MPSVRRRPVARSLAEDIRGRDDDQLATLLLERPDLARPAPADLTSLAARASTHAAVRRALEGLDRGQLQVLEALVVSGAPVADETRAATFLGLPAGQVEPVVERLWALALCWRGRDGLHVARPVAEALGSHPAGLAPPRPGAAAPDVDPLLAEAPEEARRILDRLAWGPPVGTLDVTGPLGEASRWLVARGLLEPTSEGEVLLPREVALALRGGRLFRQVQLEAPEVGGAARPLDQVARAGAGAASTLLELLDEVAEEWGARPPRVLRTGGLAVRDLRRLAGHLDRDVDTTAFVVEIAYQAGLLEDDRELQPSWLPTLAYDEWQQQPAARRWVRLARAWRDSTRAAHRIGTRDAAPGRVTSSPVNALSEEVAWPAARSMRRDVLSELAGLPLGRAPNPESLLERLEWRRPLRPRQTLAPVTRAVLAEAELLGVTGRGALTPPGRALSTGEDDAAAGALETHLPASATHLVLQADLTAVAPGRLEGPVAAFLRLAAEAESRGGAAVYRFSTESLRRALDAGWSADRLLATLRELSLTPVPQPLEYLIADAARRHGRARVGAMASYVRSDDIAALDAMQAHRDLTALRLSRLAPTVLVSQLSAPVLLEAARAAGFAPVVESPEGGLVARAPDRHRSAGRAPRPRVTASRIEATDARELVGALRRGEQARHAAERALEGRDGPAVPSSDPAVTLALVREAIADRVAVWIGVTDGVGRAERLLLRPERIEGGRIHGTVGDGHSTRAFSVHRITGAVAAG